VAQQGQVQQHSGPTYSCHYVWYAPFPAGNYAPETSVSGLLIIGCYSCTRAAADNDICLSTLQGAEHSKSLAKAFKEALSSCSMSASILAKKQRQKQGGRGWQGTFC